MDRGLRLLAEVQPGEGRTSLLLALNVLLLLCAYYLIKPVREALILAAPGGAEFKAYASGGAAVVLLVLTPAYGKLVDRFPRNRLVVGVTLFFAVGMLLFYIAGQSDALRPWLGGPFYIWASVFSMMVVAQFWGFANDIYTEEQGTRLFAIVGVGASAGSVVGSKLASWLLQAGLETYSLLLVCAVLLVGTAALTELIHSLESKPGGQAHVAKPSRSGGGVDAFGLVFSNRYLTLLALFSLLFTFVNSNGEYMLSRLVADHYQHLPAAERGTMIGEFYGEFYFWVNLVGVLIQAFFVSRVVKWLGLARAFLVFPVLVLFTSGAVGVLPSLAVIALTKKAENATDYSLNNTLRNMLWLPTTREMKYKAKQVVDTVMVRLGDVASALLIAGLASSALLSVRGMAWMNVVLTVLWLVLAQRITRAHAALSRESATHVSS